MRSARPAYRLVAGVVAVLAVLALAAGGLAWRVAGASASAAPPEAPAVEAPPPTTSSTTSTTPTSTTTSTSTSTTVKRRPVATTAAPRPPAPPPPAPPATAPPAAAPAPAPSSASDSQRCTAALQWASARGLNLPAGWGFRCPGSAVVDGVPRWGMACWDCEGTGSWIAVDIARIGSSDAQLRYVVAHELCHAMDYMALGLSSELGADLCAALHGAPRT